MRWSHRRAILAGSVCALAATVGWALPAAAATGTASISAGTLFFVTTPPNVTFSVTLNGLDQTSTAAEAIDVGDATGSGTGWNLTATSTTFTCAPASCGVTRYLSTSATTLAGAPTATCDGGSSCALPSNAVPYPYTMPAGLFAPLATKFFDATANSGMGDQTVTPTWSLSVPATTYAGTYTSTWTISLVSGP